MAPSPVALALFDIDGVVRDVGQSYRRALADTVEHFTQGRYRPSMADIDALKAEGQWNNDWLASQEFLRRYFAPLPQPPRLDYEEIVDFFQQRYRGPNPQAAATWTGYITQEPLLVDKSYFDSLSAAGIVWGFVSGATRASAEFVLTERLGLVNPPLVAMADAPDKPNPTGLLALARQLDPTGKLNALYAGDTVADIKTVVAARQRGGTVAGQDFGQRAWEAVGILPPHAWPQGAPETSVPETPVPETSIAADYRQSLLAAGADRVLERVTQLTPQAILTSPHAARS